MSQIFLREDWPCKKIAAHLKEAQVTSVLEIGPGGGILTRELLALGLQVTAVEKDIRFAEKLMDEKKLKVIPGDVLQMDLAQWIQSGPPGEKKAVCGNIPYHISSPILFWLIPHLHSLTLATLMVQKEFAARVTSLPDHKDYGSLSVFIQLRARTMLDFLVPREAFFPIPKVDSAVMSLYQRPSLDQKLLDKVELLTRQAFTQRRKKLSNSLSPFLKDVPDPKKLPVDLDKRCETMSPMDFVALARALFPGI